MDQKNDMLIDIGWTLWARDKKYTCRTVSLIPGGDMKECMRYRPSCSRWHVQRKVSEQEGGVDHSRNYFMNE